MNNNFPLKTKSHLSFITKVIHSPIPYKKHKQVKPSMLLELRLLLPRREPEKSFNEGRWYVIWS